MGPVIPAGRATATIVVSVGEGVLALEYSALAPEPSTFSSPDFDTIEHRSSHVVDKDVADDTAEAVRVLGRFTFMELPVIRGAVFYETSNITVCYVES